MIRSFDGHTPKIHPTAFVSEAAYVVGEVEIGPRSSVWPGAVIRGDHGLIQIGSDTNIQDNSVLHGDDDVIIGDNVTIGHRVMCHGRNIGNRVLIGNGAILNDGVLVGEESVIGSGSMILENMDIPEKSIVVGMPGRIRGSVKDKHVNMIDRIAAGYASKAQKYKAEGNLE